MPERCLRRGDRRSPITATTAAYAAGCQPVSMAERGPGLPSREDGRRGLDQPPGGGRAVRAGAQYLDRVGDVDVPVLVAGAVAQRSTSGPSTSMALPHWRHTRW